ncbi:MAG: HlyD family secretion protein [Rhodospirillales bacterium]|jgi:membrane fusion protein (multidrug efflux system)|nr:HlyD family secretion protein [Rhodospirillales bacterium]
MSQSAAAPHPREVGADSATRPARLRMSRHAVGPLLMIGGILVVAGGALAFWLQGGRYVSVDDAYVRAAKEALSTDVSGIVEDVPVKDGEHVAKGQVLVRLVASHFKVAIAEAKAHLAQTALTLNAMRRDYARMLRDADAKAAQVRSDQANFDRYAKLVKSGGVTRAEYDDAKFKLAADQQAEAALRLQAEVQLAKLGGSLTAPMPSLPDYQAAAARVEQAELDYGDSVIRAPFAGVVTNVDATQPGMYLRAATAAFGLVSTEHVWVEADPKETELTWVKPGDPVTVTVDTYPGRTWKGVVESIAPNSGSEFSILPAQNTSGNWVKVVQRIPVRIRVDRKPGDPDLRAGMSVEADIDTGHVRHLSDLF